MITISTETTGQKVVALLGGSPVEGTTLYNAVRVYDNADEFYASEDLAEVFSGFQGLETRIRVMKQFKFVRAYVLEDDSVYMVYITDGLEILKKVEIHSCLSTQGFCLSNNLEDCFFIDSREYYQKCEHNWSIFRESNQAICL